MPSNDNRGYRPGGHQRADVATLGRAVPHSGLQLAQVRLRAAGDCDESDAVRLPAADVGRPARLHSEHVLLLGHFQRPDAHVAGHNQAAPVRGVSRPTGHSVPFDSRLHRRVGAWHPAEGGTGGSEPGHP